MERLDAGKLLAWIKKYKYVILVLVLGILLMLLPSTREKDETNSKAATIVQQKDPAKEIEEILSHVQGIGEVKVLLTVETGEEAVYQMDSDAGSAQGSESKRLQTVVITGTDRAQTPLTRKTLGPVYRGAVVVCHGADNPSVRLKVVDAVSKATGLGADRISVLLMD